MRWTHAAPWAVAGWRWGSLTKIWGSESFISVLQSHPKLIGHLSQKKGSKQSCFHYCCHYFLSLLSITAVIVSRVKNRWYQPGEGKEYDKGQKSLAPEYPERMKTFTETPLGSARAVHQNSKLLREKGESEASTGSKTWRKQPAMKAWLFLFPYFLFSRSNPEDVNSSETNSQTDISVPNADLPGGSLNKNTRRL